MPGSPRHPPAAATPQQARPAGDKATTPDKRTRRQGDSLMTVTDAAGPTSNPTAPANPPVLGGVAPYLCLDGAGQAADFYRRAFGAEEMARMPPDASGRTMHIHLVVNGGSLMLCDPFPEHGHPLQPPQAFTLHLQVADVERWWQRALDAGAEVVLPLQDMFWGDRYGQLRDPFGVSWSL